MDWQKNFLRAVRFETPDFIPMEFGINPACWQHYPADALMELVDRHPFLFPDFLRDDLVNRSFSVVQRKDQPYLDPWGCVWSTPQDGLTGLVTGHPLADWAALESFSPPDPEQTDGLVPVDWNKTVSEVSASKARGELFFAGLRHGHTFLQLCDLRGYTNLTLDMADEDPRLWKLIGMLEEFNLALVKKYIQLGAAWMGYPDDLGMQNGPMISPKNFSKYIKPSYRRIMQPALEAGCIVHMHSDGDIRLLVDDMLESGVQVVNLQDLVNGIDWIAARFAGKVCIDLDIDRQRVTVLGSPAEIDALIREEVQKLGRKEGGLTMGHGLYPGAPLENIQALMDAMERYATMY
jgi:uroporphyrinogen decarboxylase